MKPMLDALNFPTVPGLPRLPSLPVLPSVPSFDVPFDDLPPQIEESFMKVLETASSAMPKSFMDSDVTALLNSLVPKGVDVLSIPQHVQLALEQVAHSVARAIPKDGLKCAGYKKHEIDLSEPLAKALGRKIGDWCPSKVAFEMCTDVDFSPIAAAMKPILHAIAGVAGESSSSLLEQQANKQASSRSLRSRSREDNVAEEFWNGLSNNGNQIGVTFGAAFVDSLIGMLVPTLKIGRLSGLQRLSLGEQATFAVEKFGSDHAKQKNMEANEESNFVGGSVHFAPKLNFGMDVGSCPECKDDTDSDTTCCRGENVGNFIDFKIALGFDVTFQMGLTTAGSLLRALKDASIAYDQVDKVLEKIYKSANILALDDILGKDDAVDGWWEGPAVDQKEKFRKICAWTNTRVYNDWMSQHDATNPNMVSGITENPSINCDTMAMKTTKHARFGWGYVGEADAATTMAMSAANKACTALCHAFVASARAPRLTMRDIDATHWGRVPFRDAFPEANFADKWQDWSKDDKKLTLKTLKKLHGITSDVHDRGKELFDAAIKVAGSVRQQSKDDFRKAAMMHVLETASSHVQTVSVYHGTRRTVDTILGTPCSTCTGAHYR